MCALEATHMTNQEQANLETLCGESGVSLKGMDVYNHNGDYISSLLKHELEFVKSHRCTSDCRRVGCEFVARTLRQRA